MTSPSSIDAFIINLLHKNETEDCILWPFGTSSTGYGVCAGTTAHRYILTLKQETVPPNLEEYQAAHKCGNRLCVNPKHLYWATRHENNGRDKLQQGTLPWGTKSGSAKLTEDDVRQIRALKGKISQRKIAARYNVSQGCIDLIHRNITWRYL